MIKLTRRPIADETYDRRLVFEELLKMSNNKCAYCEGSIGLDYQTERDHFYPVSKYPEKEKCWDNLLPACRRCNGTKSDWDTAEEPIVNPTIDIPKEHLSYTLCGFEARDNSPMGRNTIVCLNLNELAFMAIRLKLSCEIMDKIELCSAFLEKYNQKQSECNKGLLQNSVLGLLDLAPPKSNFSAIYATIIIIS